MLTTKVTPKKLTFGKGNEVTGWFKSTNGEKIQFTITNDGEVTQTGEEKNLHPFVLGLYEMMFSND